jgi:hypothetical protein
VTRIYSNGPQKDFVIRPFDQLAHKASHLHLAAPYFTDAGPIMRAAQAGKQVQLLVGLNISTDPTELALALRAPNTAVRYLTHRFHAKIYLFDDTALLGSANLTMSGLMANREAVICLDQPEDFDSIEEIRALFLELWESAAVLTPATLGAFTTAWRANRPKGPDPDSEIEAAVGRVQPDNIHVDSHKRSRERIFLNDLQRQVYEQYRPSFAEVSQLLETRGYRRPELAAIGPANETNRFLNWVRRTYVIGDEAWRAAPQLTAPEREQKILPLGAEWATTQDSKVPGDYIAWLRKVDDIFGAEATIEAASKDELMEGLMSLHAFTEQLRFVKGGLAKLPAAFWTANNDGLEKVRRTLTYLIHGPAISYLGSTTSCTIRG